MGKRARRGGAVDPDTFMRCYHVEGPFFLFIDRRQLNECENTKSVGRSVLTCLGDPALLGHGHTAPDMGDAMGEQGCHARDGRPFRRKIAVFPSVARVCVEER